jgi:hypothetical protein
MNSMQITSSSETSTTKTDAVLAHPLPLPVNDLKPKSGSDSMIASVETLKAVEPIERPANLPKTLSKNDTIDTLKMNEFVENDVDVDEDVDLIDVDMVDSQMGDDLNFKVEQPRYHSITWGTPFLPLLFNSLFSS